MSCRRTPRPRVAYPALFVALALAAALAGALVLAVARTTGPGLRADRSAAAAGVAPTSHPRVHEASTRLMNTVDVTSLALVGGAIALLALLRRRVAEALAALVVILGANVTTQALKAPLGELVDRTAATAAASFPSGHATVAMSLALASVLAVAGAATPLAALAGAGYAAAVGTALVALGVHYPSDVAGGYLVAATWAALAAAAVAVLRRGASEPARLTRADALGGGAAAVLLVTATFVVIAVAADRYDALVAYSRLHTSFFAASAGLAAASVTIVVAFAALLRGSRRAPPDAR